MFDSTIRISRDDRLFNCGCPVTRASATYGFPNPREPVIRQPHCKLFSTGVRLAYSLGLVLCVASCALPGVVQRQTVEYNTAAASMANQLTLLNIVRAEEHMPIYYTSIARLSGSMQVTASGGFNAQLKTASPTDTSALTNANTTGTATTTMMGSSTTPMSVVTQMAPGGTTTTTTPEATTTTNSMTTGPVAAAGTTVTNMLSRAVTSGGDIYAPSVGGQVVTGPSFDIQLLDTQQFYQGVLGEVPFSTVETFLDQGIDDKFLMRLLIERIEFRLHDDLKKRTAGSLYRVIYNNASDTPIPVPKKGGTEEADSESPSSPSTKADYEAPSSAFVNFVACHRLVGGKESKPPRPLAPASRLGQNGGSNGQVSIKDLTMLDGDKFDLATPDKKHKEAWDTKGYIGGIDPDDNVFVVRIVADKRAPFTPAMDCSDDDVPPRLAESRDDVTTTKYVDLQGTYEELQSLDIVPFTPEGPGSRSSRASGSATFTVGHEKIKTDVYFIFRSPEGLIRFLGKYLEDSKARPDLVYAFAKYNKELPLPLFSVEDTQLISLDKKHHPPLVSVRLNGTDYWIPKAFSEQENMEVISLVEEIINLQKSGADRPSTVPVHVLQ